MTTRITRQELQKKLASGAPPQVVEVLGHAYWADAHLPGALNIPVTQVDRLAPQLLASLDTEIVVYCSATSESADDAARRLLALGYLDVSVYAEGKEDWIEHGLPVERAGDTG